MVLTVLRDRVTIVWLTLVVATLLSWGFGSGFGIQSHVAASVAIIAVALIKIRLVALYFMELRDAPPALRIVFEVYWLVLSVALVGMFLLA